MTMPNDPALEPPQGEEIPLDVLEALTAPDTQPAPVEAAPAAPVAVEPPRAIRMEPEMGEQMFTPEDPRAGAYAAGRIYRVPEDIPAETAAALIAGGGYVAAQLAEEE